MCVCVCPFARGRLRPLLVKAVPVKAVSVCDFALPLAFAFCKAAMAMDMAQCASPSTCLSRSELSVSVASVLGPSRCVSSDAINDPVDIYLTIERAVIASTSHWTKLTVRTLMTHKTTYTFWTQMDTHTRHTRTNLYIDTHSVALAVHCESWNSLKQKSQLRAHE